MKRLPLFFACVVAIMPAYGKVFNVNNVTDSVDIAPGNGVCADSNGRCTLRAAVMEANAFNNTSTDTIMVPAGVYVLTRGELDITSTMVFRGANQTTTIIDGGGKYRVFDLLSAAKSVQLHTLTVRNGWAESAYSDCGESCYWDTVGGGGCILIRKGGQLALETVIVTGCRVDSRGPQAEGGGIMNRGALTIQGSQITNNRGPGPPPPIPSFGVGIFNDQDARVTMKRTTVSGNHAADGFGIGVYNLGQLVVSESTFKNNDCFWSDGKETFAYGAGGAIYNSGTLEVLKSTFNDNRCGLGGAINTDSPVTGFVATATVFNSTISGNVAYVGGGAIYQIAGDLTVQNSTITGNSSKEVGGIYNIGNVSVKNSIVAGNSDTYGEPDCNRLTSLNYSLIGNTSGCTIPAGGEGNLLNVDPTLGVLKNNGGRTETHRLLGGSMAIDSGSPAPPGSGGNACQKVDQRGIARPQGVNCDMGAYEDELE
jgi:hypothetical protein